MAEKPILFSGEMVRAILDGRKTQTRRAIKSQPQLNQRGYSTWKHGVFMEEYAPFHCPYGKPGDLLWVRETWASHKLLDDSKPSEFTNAMVELPLYYRADRKIHQFDQGRWRPSIHMPRWASRITLRVCDVRVERVQDISTQDCAREGVRGELVKNPGHPSSYNFRRPFQALWDSINGPRGFGWDVNPLVWVVEFSVLDQNGQSVDNLAR